MKHSKIQDKFFKKSKWRNHGKKVQDGSPIADTEKVYKGTDIEFTATPGTNYEVKAGQYKGYKLHTQTAPMKLLQHQTHSLQIGQ